MKIRCLKGVDFWRQSTETPFIYEWRAEGEFECNILGALLKAIPRGRVDIGGDQRLELGEQVDSGNGPDQEINVKVKIYPGPMILP